MLWACILLPHLALDVVLRRHPHAGEPLVLVDGPPQQRRVLAANEAALAAGVRAGQSLAAAAVLCARLHAVPANPDALARWRRFLGDWAWRYSSQVSLGHTDAVLLEAGHSFGAIGAWPVFERRLRADLVELGFRHRIALAPTASAARVLAGHCDGLAVMQPQVAVQALAQVPLALARLPEDARARLLHVGLRTLGQVFALPRAALARRFGLECVEHLDRMRGHAPEALPLHQPAAHFDLRIEFGHELLHSEALLFPLRRLLGDLATCLACRDRGVQRFRILIDHDDHPDTEVSVGLLAPERDPARLFELSKLRLEQTTLPAPALGLRVLAEELPPYVPDGRDLLDARSRQQMDWPALCERLRARLGDAAVHGLAPVSDHRPERAWRSSVQAPRQPYVTDSPPRPTWLLTQPLPLRDAAPRIIAGPERIESGWWDGMDVRRDYYLLETSSGQLAWAFSAPGEQGPFMLHGWFA